MDKFLPPSVAAAFPKLEETFDILTQQKFKRAITDYTKELCMDDMEIADLIIEGKKTLPRCIRYVLQKAQENVATQLEAQCDPELDQLESMKVLGIVGRMAGAAVDQEQLFQWAKEYYYGGTAVEPKDASISLARPGTVKKGKTDSKKSGKGTGTAAAVSDNKKSGTGKQDGGAKSPAASPATAKDPNAMDGGTQIGFGDLTTPADAQEKPAA